MAHDDRNTHDSHVTLGDTDSLKTTADGQLVHLDDLDDFTIAEGEPDIRGWDVRGADGTKVGTVEDLLIDTAAMKVRYIEVKLEADVAKDVGRPSDLRAHGITDATMRADEQIAARDDLRSDPSDAGRYVLVPIGVARLNDEDDDVILSAEAAQMVGIPAYDRQQDRLTRDYESEVVRGYDGGLATGGIATNDVMRAARPSDVQGDTRDAFYEDGRFDDRSFFGTRRSGRDDDAYVTPADEAERARRRDNRTRDAVDADRSNDRRI